MSISKTLPFLLIIICLSYIFFQKSSTIPEDQRVLEKKKAPSKYDSTIKELWSSDMLNKYFYKDENPYDLEQLTKALSKNLIIDSARTHQITHKKVDDCTDAIFEADQHIFEYRTCITKGFFWSRLKLDGKKITASDVILLENQDHIFNEDGFRVNVEQINLLQIGNKKYWEIRGGAQGCTGTGCYVTFTLLFDLQSRKLYDFTGFRIGKSNFMDLDQDGNIDYLEETYEVVELESPGIHMRVFKAFTQNNQGKFVPMKDAEDKTYYVKAYYQGDRFLGGNVSGIEYHWMSPVEFP